MRNLIRRILKEETNDTINLINQYYDVDVIHRKISKYVYKTFVRFTPKDSKNDMTPYTTKSWAIWHVKELKDGTLNLDFYDCAYIRSTGIPLLDYIGGTYHLDNYVEELHRKEIESVIDRFGL
jgi:hypothetical protein